MDIWSARTVVKTREFEAQCVAICANVARMDEVLFALEWAVATKPEFYPVVPGTNEVRVAKTELHPDIPACRVYYVFTDNEVTFLEIDALEPDESDIA